MYICARITVRTMRMSRVRRHRDSVTVRTKIFSTPASGVGLVGVRGYEIFAAGSGLRTLQYSVHSITQQLSKELIWAVEWIERKSISVRGDKATAGFQPPSRRHPHVVRPLSHGRFPSLGSLMPCAATSSPARLAASYSVFSHPRAT